VNFTDVAPCGIGVQYSPPFSGCAHCVVEGCGRAVIQLAPPFTENRC
jgi:hypothetical protein